MANTFAWSVKNTLQTLLRAAITALVAQVVSKWWLTLYEIACKPTKAVLWPCQKLTLRKAFNEIKRSHFVQAASQMFPKMSNWTAWCYDAPSMLLYDHEHIKESCAGVQQGGIPLDHCTFVVGTMQIINAIAE